MFELVPYAVPWIVVYLYEILSMKTLSEIYIYVYHTGSVLDALFILSYFIIAAGLYAHVNYDKWSLKQLEVTLESLESF